MLPKWKISAPEIKTLLLFKKKWFQFREHAPETEILCPRIENICPVQKKLVFNLGSMLPILKIAPCMEISIFYESMVK